MLGPRAEYTNGWFSISGVTAAAALIGLHDVATSSSVFQVIFVFGQIDGQKVEQIGVPRLGLHGDLADEQSHHAPSADATGG